jgi:hypothetical protein
VSPADEPGTQLGASINASNIIAENASSGAVEKDASVHS